jgi:iron complex transport system substrate-binding protein
MKRAAALTVTCAVVLWAVFSSPETAAVNALADFQTPRRIVSLVPAVTEMLFAIGAGDAVVGISSFDRYPPEALERTRVGALVDPDVERMLSLKPDLVIVYGTQGDLIARLERAGVPMFNYEHAGLSDITATLRALGARVGYAGAADRLATEIERDIAAIRSRVSERQRPSTAVIIGREPGGLRGIYASAGIGFLHDMLEAAGGNDVFADVARQNLQVSVEVLLARAPQVIIEVHPPEGWTPERLTRERNLWRAFPGLPAVRNDRVYLIADDAVLVPGPRVVEGIRRMAEVLHPGVWK